MKKPHIVCHMMASVDGRIDCDMTEKIESGEEYYEALAELNAPTTLCGRVTARMHYALPGTFEATDATPIGQETFHKASEADAYAIVADSKGTLLWDGNRLDDQPLLCIVSTCAPQEYLDYLKANGISFIATGREQTDLKRAMELLAEEFGVTRLAIVGGGKVNGGFLSAGLIDEMSLMIAPGIDGRSDQPSVFDGIPATAEPTRLRLTHCKAYECGTVWMRYAVG